MQSPIIEAAFLFIYRSPTHLWQGFALPTEQKQNRKASKKSNKTESRAEAKHQQRHQSKTG